MIEDSCSSGNGAMTKRFNEKKEEKVKDFMTLVKLRKSVWPIGKGPRGITGLETAIILIAFVVVASVFSFTVLSTGIFSSERGKETIIAGLKEVRETLEPRGSIIANGAPTVVVDSADANWTAQTDVTSALSTTDFKEGTASVELTVAALFATGLVATNDLASAVDLSDHTYVRLWIKSSLASAAAGDLELVLDDTAGCGSPVENIDLPVLTADTWTDVKVASADASLLTAIACVGLNATVDPGATVINVDDIRAPGQITNVVFNITNAVGGEAVDMTQPTDSDTDGEADSDSTHVTVLSYTDGNQFVKDIYWTKTVLGTGDSDNLLETREVMEITVDLSSLGATTPLETNAQFTVEMKPPNGAVVIIRRTTPAEIDTITSLQ